MHQTKSPPSIRKSHTIPFEEGSAEIQKGIDVLLCSLESGRKKVFEPQEFIAVKTVVYDMKCHYRSKLYDQHRETFTQYLQNVVSPALRKALRHGSVTFLSSLQRHWAKHQIMNKWMHRIFWQISSGCARSFDRDLERDGLEYFKIYIYDPMKEDITLALIDAIREDREGQVLHTHLVNDVIDIYQELDVYDSDLEDRLLSSTSDYFSEKRVEWMGCYSVREYALTVEKCLEREESYIVPKFLDIAKNELLDKAKVDLLENKKSGFSHLMDNKCTEDLNRLYRLYAHVDDGHIIMASIFKRYMGCKEMVGYFDLRARSLFYSECFGNVEICFKGNRQFLMAFVEHFISLNTCEETSWLVMQFV